MTRLVDRWIAALVTPAMVEAPVADGLPKVARRALSMRAFVCIQCRAPQLKPPN